MVKKNDREANRERERRVFLGNTSSYLSLWFCYLATGHNSLETCHNSTSEHHLTTLVLRCLLVSFLTTVPLLGQRILILSAILIFHQLLLYEMMAKMTLLVLINLLRLGQSQHVKMYYSKVTILRARKRALLNSLLTIRGYAWRDCNQVGTFSSEKLSLELLVSLIFIIIVLNSIIIQLF